MTLRVLRHRGVADDMVLPSDLTDRVEVTDIPGDESSPVGVDGEVLFTTAWRAPMSNLYEVVERGDVRWVHLYGTGVEQLDLYRLTEGGRIVTNSAGAAAIPVAEWVLSTLLAFEKQLPETWLDQAPDLSFGRRALGTLYGRRLALLGLGGIGTAVAQRALPFGTQVRVLRRTSAPSPIPGVEVVASLAGLLQDADHVVLAVPLTPATRRAIDDKAFRLMKPGVHLVNVARGGLVDHDALRSALDDGTVARASLDVTDPEPPPAGHWLYEHPKVRLTAHVSSKWPGSRETHVRIFLANLRAYLRGDPLVNRVAPDVGY
jgi:phosphoglycerate dehydrogenase-like enzyme